MPSLKAGWMECKAWSRVSVGTLSSSSRRVRGCLSVASAAARAEIRATAARKRPMERRDLMVALDGVAVEEERR